MLRVTSRTTLLGIAAIMLSLAFCQAASAAGWTMYRAHNDGNPVTTESLAPDLQLTWTLRPAYPPKPAWPMPSEEIPRMHCDNAYHVTSADGQAYYASSATGEVYALDAATGAELWSFVTEGPVRFTPTLSDGKVYFGSDDGFVYCLRASDGGLVWKYRAGPSDEKVIGNGSMISLWPVRTSILIDQGEALFAAGVFPYEGIYVCALDAATGRVAWRNDTIGDRAHELDFGGISPHGYLVGSEKMLYVPSGRAMPAAFDRHNGGFKFFAPAYSKRGGVWALLHDDMLFAGEENSGEAQKYVYDAETGTRLDTGEVTIPAIDMAMRGDAIFTLMENSVKQLARKSEAPRDLKSLKTVWNTPMDNPQALAVARDSVIVGGGGVVRMFDANTGEATWEHAIEGSAVGLAIADGRLFVSSDAGPIYCFSPLPPAAESPAVRMASETPAPQRALARRIMMETRIKTGWGLVPECGDGDLLVALAKESKLKLVGLENDPAKRMAAREKLDAAGLLGVRAVVEPWPLDELPQYFANLIVCEDSLAGADGELHEAAYRVLHPYDGIALSEVGKDTAVLASKVYERGPLEGAGQWTHQFGDVSNTSCSADELVRGALGMLWFGEPGPQGMVERHANAQAPLVVNGRLFIQGEERILAVDAYNGALLWERDIPGAVRIMVKTDAGNLAASADGLYIAAEDRCYRLDPATGETVREYPLPGAGDGPPRRWGYIAVDGHTLYGSAAMPLTHEYGAFLKQLVEDGQWKDDVEVPADFQALYKELKKSYPIPNDDLLRALQRRGLLWAPMEDRPRGGEFTQQDAVTDAIMISDKVFALDTETGEVRWLHEGERIANVSLAIGDGMLFLADGGVSEEDRQLALSQRKEAIAAGTYEDRSKEAAVELDEWVAKRDALKAAGKSVSKDIDYMIESLGAELLKSEHPLGTLSARDLDVRRVSAIDLATGETRWEEPLDLTGCGGDGMGAAVHEGRLLFFGNYGNHDAWRHIDGGMKWRRIATLDAATGKLDWSRPLNYRTRPLFVGEKIVIEPRACDLATGDYLNREHPITGAEVPWEFLRPGHTCGITTASAGGLFYRSSCAAYYDLDDDRGVALFGGYRPGCAISLVPASGVLLSPESGAGCTCSYPVKCSFALVPKPERAQPFTVFVTPEDTGAVEHFAINLGAPADMKSDDGMVWFGYPNPETEYTKNHYPGYGVKFDLKDQLASGGAYFSADYKGLDIQGTNQPWLFTSGCEGFRECTVPLGADTTPKHYTVRLGFMARPGTAAPPAFDIALQGKVVEQGFALSPNDAMRAVVREYKGIEGVDKLQIALNPDDANKAGTLLNFIEVLRE